MRSHGRAKKAPSGKARTHTKAVPSQSARKRPGIQILDAAVETLRKEGFAGATSRAIARAGSFNQALVFYYFGSLDSLLVAALERTSEARLACYREALVEVTTLEQLVETLAALYAEDRTSGHMTVVSQMVAGSLTRPALAPQVLERMRPWLALAEETVE